MGKHEIISCELKQDDFTLFTFDELISVKIDFDCGHLCFFTAKDAEETRAVTIFAGERKEFFIQHRPVTETDGEKVPMLEKFSEYVINSAVGRGLVFSLKSIESLCRSNEKLYKGEKDKFVKSEFNRLLQHVTTGKGRVKKPFYKIDSWIIDFNDQEREKRLSFFLEGLDSSASIKLPGCHKTSAKIGLCSATGRELINLTRKEMQGKKEVKRKWNEETEQIIKKLKESSKYIIYDREKMTVDDAVYILVISKIIKERRPEGKLILVEQRLFLRTLMGESSFNKLTERQIKYELEKVKANLKSLSKKRFKLRGNPADMDDFTAEINLFTFGVVSVGQKESERKNKEGKIILYKHRESFSFGGYEAISPPEDGDSYWRVNLRPFHAVYELDLTDQQRKAVLNIIFCIMADMEGGQERIYEWLRMARLPKFRNGMHRKGITGAVGLVMARMGYYIADMGHSFRVKSPKMTNENVPSNA